MNDVSAKPVPALSLRPRLLALIGQILDKGDGASHA